MGCRASGLLSCLLAGLFMSLAGYLNSVFIGGVSMFFLMIVLQSFFGSGNYSIVGPYMGELWPARLRGSSMGLVYGVGNLGKFIGPAGLALIAGSSNYVAPQATPGRLYQLSTISPSVIWSVPSLSGSLASRRADARSRRSIPRCLPPRNPPLARRKSDER